MPMIDIQRRHQTIFRIRFGEQVATSKGKRPAKLTDAIRVTSPNADVIDAFIDVYGGKREPWEGQFEAKLPTTALNILVLPGQSVSQWWERYRGSVCERRCDGFKETKSGKPCMCSPDVEVRTATRDECAPTTRVSVICPDVAVVGSGMFICHGLVGAETLPQSIAVAEAALSRGLMVPAVLRVVEFKGRNHFIVPQIEVVGVSFNALTAMAENGELPHATREIEAPATVVDVPSAPRFTPVAPAQLPPARRLAEQFGEFEDQAAEKVRARGQRANAAVPIPATGVALRGAGIPHAGGADGGEVDGDERAPARGEAPDPSATTVTENAGGGPVDVASVSDDRPDPPVETVNDEGAQMIGMWCADHGINDALRPAFLWAFSGGEYRSAHDVPTDVLGDLRQTLALVKRGELVLKVDPTGECGPELVLPSEDSAAEPVARAEPAPADVTWRALLGQVKGVGQAKLLRRARDLAAERDLELPKSIDEIPPALNADLRAWLDEQVAA